MRAELLAPARRCRDLAIEPELADGLILVECRPQVPERLGIKRAAKPVARRGMPVVVVGSTGEVERMRGEHRGVSGSQSTGAAIGPAKPCGIARHTSLDQAQLDVALAGQQVDLGLREGRLIGFHTPVGCELAYDDASERVVQRLARQRITVVPLARLAIAAIPQPRRIRADLLKDGMCRTLHAAEIGGLHAFAVHIKDDEARRFCGHFGLATSPTDPLHLFLPIKDLRPLLSIAAP